MIGAVIGSDLGYWDIVTAIKQRSYGWGKPEGNLEVDKRAAALWSLCPELELPSGTDQVVCDQSSCVQICRTGTRSIGNRKTRCRWNHKRGFFWTKTLSGCTGCDPAEPSSSLTDSNVEIQCTTNQRNMKICNASCWNEGDLDGPSRFRCKCQMNQNKQRSCNWASKEWGTLSTEDFQNMTCQGGWTTGTTTETTPVTTPVTTPSTTPNTTPVTSPDTTPATTPQTTPTTQTTPETTPETTPDTTPVTTPAPVTSLTVAPEFKPLSDKIPSGLDRCGTSSDRIVNGVDADSNTWPWIVNMGFQDSTMVGTGSTFQCGGTIINSKYILTAAHCCRHMANAILKFGQYRLGNLDAGEFQMETENILIHPDYAPPRTNFDVCLVRAPKDIFDEAQKNGCGPNCVNSACLPEAPAVHGEACWTAGWGTLTSAGTTPNKLQSVGVNIMSDDYCSEKSKGGFNIASDEMCAGLPDADNNGLTDAGKDACQGDSGGPLVCNVNGKVTLNGIVSWGVGCAAEGFPGVYGEVYDYLDWINANSIN